VILVVVHGLGICQVPGRLRVYEGFDFFNMKNGFSFLKKAYSFSIKGNTKI